MGACLILLFQAKGTYFPTPLFVHQLLKLGVRWNTSLFVGGKKNKVMVEKKGF